MNDPIVMTALTLLIIAGIIMTYPIIGAAIALAIALWWFTRQAKQINHTDREARAARRDRDSELIERADLEHQQILEGDDRGIYGQYTPYC